MRPLRCLLRFRNTPYEPAASPFLLFLFFASMLLFGCTSLGERVLTPDFQGTKTAERDDTTGICLPTQLETSAISPPLSSFGPNPLAGGRVAVGYENRFEPGADPLPCNRRRNHAHQAALRFDLSEFTGRGVSAETAVLEADVEIRTNVTTGRESCQMALGLAATEWLDGNVIEEHDNPLSQIPTNPLPDVASRVVDPLPVGPRSWNVVNTVNRWLLGTMQNHGFVFVPPEDRTFQENNEYCVLRLSNPRLRMTLFAPRP